MNRDIADVFEYADMDECPVCGEAGYSDPEECTFCANESDDDKGPALDADLIAPTYEEADGNLRMVIDN